MRSAIPTSCQQASTSSTAVLSAGSLTVRPQRLAAIGRLLLFEREGSDVRRAPAFLVAVPEAGSCRFCCAPARAASAAPPVGPAWTLTGNGGGRSPTRRAPPGRVSGWDARASRHHACAAAGVVHSATATTAAVVVALGHGNAKRHFRPSATHLIAVWLLFVVAQRFAAWVVAHARSLEGGRGGGGSLWSRRICRVVGRAPSPRLPSGVAVSDLPVLSHPSLPLPFRGASPLSVVTPCTCP